MVKKYLVSKALFAFLFLFSQTNMQSQHNAVLDISGNYKVTNVYNFWQLKYKPTSDSVYTQINSNINSNSYTLRLNPFVKMDFSAKSLMAYWWSEWSEPVTVNEEYDLISKSTGYSYDFNSSAISEGWRGYRLENTTSINGSNILETNFLYNGTAGKSLFYSWSGDRGLMLVSPKITDLATDKKFSFYVATSNSSKVIYGTITNPYDPSTFHPLKTVTYNNGSTFVKETVFMNNYNSEDQYIAVKSSGNNGTVYFDDFSYEQSVNCFDLTNVNVSDISQHTAQLNFTASGQDAREVSLKNLKNGITNVFTTTNYPVVLENLSGNTNYEVKIRANCGGGLYSNWSSVIPFTTICTPLTEGYSTSFLETEYLDPCWTGLTQGSGSISQISTNLYLSVLPRTGSKLININIGGSTADQKAYLITPYIQDLDDNKKIAFYLISNGFNNYNSHPIIIGTMSNPNEETTFTPLKTIAPGEMNEIGGQHKNRYWKKHIVYLDNYNNELNHHYIALKVGIDPMDYLNSGGNFFIDDFVYGNIPDCKEPTNLNVTMTDYNSAIVKWDDYDNPVHEWQIEYGPTGFLSGTGTLITVNSNPFQINQLSGNTEYDFYVRTKCGANFSSWSDRGYFKTRCEGIVSGYSIDFENDDFEVNNSCWRRLTPQFTNRYWNENIFIKVAQNVPGQPISTHSGVKAIMHRNQINAPDPNVSAKNILVTPRLIDFDNFKKISFWMYCKQNSYALFKGLTIGTLSDPNDYTTFTPFRDISGTFVENQWKEYTVDFSGYSGQDKYIGIRQKSTNGDYIIYLDDFRYYSVECATPTGLRAYQSGNNSVKMEWTTNQTANIDSWEIEYGSMGFTPGSGTVISVNSNPYQLEGLIPFAKYEFRVRNNCGNGIYGDWSEKYAFRNSCAVSTPFSENFDQYNASENNTPSGIQNFCWTPSNANVAGLLKYVPFETINSNPNAAQLSYYGNNAASGIHHKPGMLSSPYLADFGNDKRVKFWAKRDGGETNLIVGTIENPLDYTTFEPYTTISLNDIPLVGKEFNIDFSNYSGTNKHIAFLHGGNDTYTYIFIDDIYYDVIPLCLEPTNILAKNVNSDSALIVYDYVQNSQIEFGPTGFAMGTGTIVSNSGSEILISGLIPNTGYDYYVKTICGLTGESIIVGPKKFRTTCEEVISLPWGENFNSMPSYGNNILPNCFKTINPEFVSMNVPQQLTPGSGGYSFDYLLTGYGDTSYIWFNNGTISQYFFTPLFRLTAGTTYTFSMKTRVSYQYGNHFLYSSVGRGNTNEAMETELEKSALMYEYAYGDNKFVFTPIVSGDYSFKFKFGMSSNSINCVMDQFRLDEGYTNTIVTNNEFFDFQYGANDKVILESTEYAKILNSPDPENSSNKLLVMRGSSNPAVWKTGQNVWENNGSNITKVNMKIIPNAMTSLYMRFDLKQTYIDNNNESMFRVVVNGNVLGNVLKPVTANQDNFETFEFDLSPYLGTDIKISLQHIGKSNAGTGDNALLDNLTFSPYTLSDEKFAFKDLKVFPNPTNNILTIQNNEVLTGIEIVNISGQVLYASKFDMTEVKLDLSDYSSGVYFVRITSNEKRKLIKVIKN